MKQEMTLADWDALTSAMMKFDEDVVTTDDRIEVELGTAHIILTRDGTIDTGMPLHSFEHNSADPNEISITVHDDSLEFGVDKSHYVFKHP